MAETPTLVPLQSLVETDSAPDSLPVNHPSSSAIAFPIVGIGASAGGLAAFEEFFAGMPTDKDPGMAFVLVQHLLPDHQSLLSEIIRRFTRMQVFDVEDGIMVQPNCVYIIPPGRDMALMKGSLQLLEPTEPHGQRLPIDFFFRSLALDQHELAIGIILSGTGSDGAMGVRAIKSENGMVMVQDSASAEYDGMPRSAMATRLVDYELPPAEMPAQLIVYLAHASGKRSRAIVLSSSKVENALKKIFLLLRAQTGHDFSQYKPNTVHRRIERRMAVHQIESIDDYVRCLQKKSFEVQALFRDLLIGVTNFFRDPEVFDVLEKQVIPKLFGEKPAGSEIRIWSAGCSTGEEAYSLAILLVERIEVLKQSYTVQIFATDIDEDAIATARAGVYPLSIAAYISPERLARFFTAEAGGSGYRINKNIRDLLVFSEQDVVQDPPFSRLDLISCRNLLIYMDKELQQKLIPLFHYALKPDGWLFLGKSEGIGEFIELFKALDPKTKLYRRKANLHGAQRESMKSFMPSITAVSASLRRGLIKSADAELKSLRELTEKALLTQVIAAGVLVNAHGDILYLHGRTGIFLELPQGEARINNILKMARKGLRRALSTSLHKAAGLKETVLCPGLSVKTNAHYTTVNLTICPVTDGQGATPEEPLYLVILEEVAVKPEISVQTADLDGPMVTSPDVEALIATLRMELRLKDEYIQSTNEEMESYSEELKSSNEEMQSVNEELQSTNEEMETSKEELQSLNEELATLNTELQTKVMDLSRINNDMNNLLAGTGVGTVFVDFQLRILRFTPAACSIINLIPSDVGRPVTHLASNLVGYSNLNADVNAVLNTLVCKEVQVQTSKGKFYTMHIQPYRTLDNVIEGAVISFVDITEIVKTREKLAEANNLSRMAVVVRDAHDAITVQNLEGQIIAWNPGAVRMYGWSESEALQMKVCDRIPERLRDDALITLVRLSGSEILESYRTQRITKEGQILDVSIISTALVNEAGEIYGIATTERLI